SPTPLHGILRDPSVLTTFLSSHRKKPRRGSSASHTPRMGPRKKEREHRDRERESDSASILTHVLAEEERQARHLKAVLRQTATRLEEELRRADGAEARARTAELGLADVGGRLGNAEVARHQLELDATRAQEECRRWQMQADAAEREARRMQAELGRAERARQEADQAEREARDTARRAEQVLREWQAREAGREEVRRLEVRRRYSDGRDEGFEDGRAEGYEAGHQDGYEAGQQEGYEQGRDEGLSAGRIAGFEEGRKAGHADGLQVGYSQGRKEERAKALEAFDRFIENEMGHRPRDNVTEYEEDRTKRWVEATRKTWREHDLSPLPPQPSTTTPPRPAQAQREPSPAPKLVWLHRPLNHHREPSSDASRSTLQIIPLAEQRA
ncbi:hypothetical protein LXA43DRAFT_889442, partial [Ganoderma leucocontextum]